LFFKPDERPFQIWNDTEDYRMGIQLWNKIDAPRCHTDLPSFGKRFSLTKQQ
jgi:hypothetical protein